MTSAPTTELVVEDVWDYYDGPILFTAVDASESRYICAFLNNQEDSTRFLCSRIGPTRLRKFLAGGIDLREAMMEAPMRHLLILETTNEDKPLLGKQTDLSEVDESLLPAEGYFLDAFTSESILLKEHLVINTSLEVREAEQEPVVSSYTLAAFLRSFQDLIKYAYKKSLSKLKPEERKFFSSTDFHTIQVCDLGAHASFGLKFRSKESADLTYYVQLERALERAAMFLKFSGDTERSINVLKDNKGHLVGAYRRLLSFIVQHNASIRIQWRAPRSDEQTHRYHISVDEARKLQTALSQQRDLEDENITISGVIIHLHTESGAWTLESDDGEHHCGKVQPGKDVTLGGLTAKVVRYNFFCKEEIKEDALGGEIRSLLLYAYSEV